MTAPLKLALISRRYPPLVGGAERVFAYLAEALAREGADVAVLTSAIDEAAATPDLEAVAVPGAKVGGRLTIHRLSTSPLRFIGTLAYMRNLKTWLTNNHVDLAYASMLKHDAYVATGVGFKRGFPVVLRPEGAGATGDVAWQARANFGRWIAARCRRADAFVAISKAVHHELIGAGYESSKIRDLPNGVPIPRRAWQRRPNWRESPHAVFVGRLAAEKNLGTLIRAWPTVRQSFPTARLTLVGEGPKRRMLEDCVRELGLPNGAVTLPGALSEVEPLLRSADLFVLPSTEEGMSVALLEAMALGVPTVASAIPGNRRLIADFKQGRLAAPEPDALARAIVDQWTHFDRAFHMSRAARSRVEQKFSITSMARQHLELFHEIIAKRDHKPT